MHKPKLLSGLSVVVGALFVLLLSQAMVTQAASVWASVPIEPRQATDQDILSPGYSQTVSAGNTVTFTHALTNTSDITDSFVLTATSSHGWPVKLYGLTETLTLPVQLEAGFTTTVLLQITVPSGIVSGTLDSAIITATSQTSPTLTSESIDMTVIQDPIWYTYLPLVSKPLPPLTGIYGRVTYLGAPASGHQVTLQLCNRLTALNWTCPVNQSQSVSTQIDGSYQFTTAASLGANQKYRVAFYNYYLSGNPNYLTAAGGPDILSYTSGQTVAGGTFDVANVSLLEPTDAITIEAPFVFRWTPRTIDLSDSYQLSLWNASDESIYFYSPLLGHVGSYTLTSLPANFPPGTYAWQVLLHSSTGWGTSFETRLVTFPSTNRK